MNIIEKVNAEYRAKDGYGIRFSIDQDDAYKCDRKDVEFGRNNTWRSGGYEYNEQPIMIGGKRVGWLLEWMCGRLFDPMCMNFRTECRRDEKGNPHCVQGEYGPYMEFARLQDLVNYVTEED